MHPSSHGIHPAIRSLVLGCASAGLWGGYGDTQVVEARWDTIIPPGWAIIDNKAGNRTATGEPQSYYGIVDLRNGPFGERLVVWGGSPIPPGWVIQQVYGGDVTDRYAIRFGITNLNGAPAGTCVMIAGIPHSPVPEGWTITGQSPDSRDPNHYPKLFITNPKSDPEAVPAGTGGQASSCRLAVQPNPVLAIHPGSALAIHPNPAFAVHSAGNHVLHGTPRDASGVPAGASGRKPVR